jgi:alpha-L-arabinofuranosidase
MRLVTPDVELVVCGSSIRSMPTFAGWEAEVLEQAYDQVDYVSCHAYDEELDGDHASFLASATDLDRFVDAVVATADHIGAKLRCPKRINLSFDEWNVWYLERHRAAPPATEWRVAPRLIEDEYSSADAVVVGSLLMALLRHSDRVSAAALAQLVNVIAPIRTPNGPSWRQTTFYPFALTSRHAVGDVLRVEPAAPTYQTARHGEVPLVDAVATRDADAGETAIFVVNRSIGRPVPLDVDIRALSPCALVEALTVTDADPYATNNQQRPDRVRPVPLAAVTVDSGTLLAVLPPVSWSMLRLSAVSQGGIRT